MRGAAGCVPSVLLEGGCPWRRQQRRDGHMHPDAQKTKKYTDPMLRTHARKERSRETGALDQPARSARFFTASVLPNAS